MKNVAPAAKNHGQQAPPACKLTGCATAGAAARDEVFRVFRKSHLKEDWVVKLTLRDNESIQEAVRRFRKLVERSGIKKEMRRREYYEKPSEIKRRARLRAERRSRRTRMLQGA